MNGDTSKLDQTKYCAFHKGPGHITNYYITWTRYLEKERKMRPVCRQASCVVRQDVDADAEPPAKTIRLNESLLNLIIWGPPIVPRRGRSNRRNQSSRFKP
ncbi:hypothetical protein COP1_034457 [Malus domestica]